MAKLDDKQFTYFKDIVSKDTKEHDTQLKSVNKPEQVIMAYNSKFKESYGISDSGIDADSGIIENYLFIGAATILPTLFYQLPKINIRSKRDNLQFEASVLTSLMNASFGDKEKLENQLCIIDAFLPYGYAVIKNGYNSRMGKAEKPSVLTGEGKTDKPNDMEADNEFIQYEQAISIRQSPKKTYLDSSQPFGKGNRITFEYTRTLQQLIDANLYDLSSNFIAFFSARDNDKRKVDLTLTEHWTMENGFAWKLSYVDGWDEPIKWIKSNYKYLPVSYLRFNKMGDVLYGISHGTLALKAQNELNYLNELWKKHVDNIRNQHLVYMKGLSESGKKTLRQNDIGGIVESNEPLAAGIALPLQGATADPQLFGNIQSVRGYLQLILSTTGGKTGGKESELATTEKNKALGDALRQSGMQDAIRDFYIDQIKQRIKNFLRFGTPDMILKMTGSGLTNPETGQPIQPNTELSIGGEGGFLLTELIKGNIDTDFIFDVDIQSASRPDYPVIRKQIAEGIALATNLQPALVSNGKKANIDLMLEDYFATFDAIPDSSKYITDMSPEEMASIQQQQAQEGTTETKVKKGVPNDGSIERSTKLTSPGAGTGQ